MCQKLEEGQCPAGLDMFLRTRPILYVSGEANVDADEKILVSILNVSDPDEPVEFYKTSHTITEPGDLVTIPMKPGSFPVGSYLMYLAQLDDEEPAVLQFSVWNTQAEIDARKELGDQSGMQISNVRLCKEPVNQLCEESFHKIKHGTKELHTSFDYAESLDGTNLKLQWLRNGRQIQTQNKEIESSSGRFYAMIGYKNASMERGSYTLVLTASKSKQGILRKTVVIR